MSNVDCAGKCGTRKEASSRGCFSRRAPSQFCPSTSPMSRCWRSASSSCATAVLAAAVRPRPSLPLSSLLASRRNASSSSSSSSSSHDSTAHESEVYPEEGASLTTISLGTSLNIQITGFNAPFWTKIAVSGILLTLAIRLSPSDVHASSHDEQPYLTRYIQHNLTPATDLWKKRNERHLDLAVEAASDKLLFQEAQTAPIKRLRYLGCVRLCPAVPSDPALNLLLPFFARQTTALSTKLHPTMSL